MRNRNKGFTLVEILIVVVILGILAAIVVPQFTNASSEAVKGALQSQLQTITSQIELYRVRNNGAKPDDVSTSNFLTASANNGWGDMVSAQYLKEEPMNGYTGKTLIVAGNEAAAMAEDRNSADGWFYDTTTSSVFAAGYDKANNKLKHEDGFGGSTPAP